MDPQQSTLVAMRRRTAPCQPHTLGEARGARYLSAGARVATRHLQQRGACPTKNKSPVPLTVTRQSVEATQPSVSRGLRGRRWALAGRATGVGPVFTVEVRRFDSEATGVALYALSALCMAVMHVGVKLSVEAGLAVPLVILSRTLFGIAAALAVLTVAKRNPLGTQRAMLLSRGIVGTGGVIGALYASASLPLAIVSLLSFTAPLATAAAASITLKEPFPPELRAVAMLSMAGVLVLLEPWSASAAALDPTAVFAAAVSPACVGLAAVLVRRLSTSGKPEHPQVVMLYLSSVTAVIAIGLCALTPGSLQPSPEALLRAWPALLLVGAAGWLSQLCITMSLARAPAALASSMGYTQLVYTSLADMLIFGTVLKGSQLCGALIILSGTAYIGISKLAAYMKKKND